MSKLPSMRIFSWMLMTGRVGSTGGWGDVSWIAVKDINTLVTHIRAGFLDAVELSGEVFRLEQEAFHHSSTLVAA